MTDILSPEKRSWNMSRIKGKDTKPEKIVRSNLFKNGFRFRKNDSRFPGKPDVVLPKYKTVIFVNGCFWHQHSGCKQATMPKSNTEFWEKKLNRNVEKDKENISAIKSMGWNAIVIWECEINKNFEQVMKSVIEEIRRSR